MNSLDSFKILIDKYVSSSAEDAIAIYSKLTS